MLFGRIRLDGHSSDASQLQERNLQGSGQGRMQKEPRVHEVLPSQGTFTRRTGSRNGRFDFLKHQFLRQTLERKQNSL